MGSEMMKGISLGPPAIPAENPTEGIQTAPIVVIRCIVGSDVEAGHPILHAKATPQATEQAQNWCSQSDEACSHSPLGIRSCRYFTTFQSQINDVLRPRIVRAAQMSTNQEYFCIAAEGETTFGRMVGETSPLRSKSQAPEKDVEICDELHRRTLAWSLPPAFSSLGVRFWTRCESAPASS